MSPRPGRGALLAALLLAVVGCAPAVDGPQDTGAAEAGPRLVATTSILGDVVTRLAGGDATVTVLMPPGVDPHGYEPSAQDGRLVREADLVVANGLGLEEGLDTVLDAAVEEGVPVFRLAEHVDPLPAPGHAHDHEGADEDDGPHLDEDDRPDGDPHVWLDPVRMAQGVRLLAEEIAALPMAGDGWGLRGDDHADELLAVHDELTERFAAVPPGRRRLVTNHESLGYLAARYDLEVIGTVVPGTSPEADADPRGFAQLVEAVEAAGVDVVFAEITDGTTLAEQLRAEVASRGGVDIEIVRVHTDALGEPGSGADTHIGLLRSTGTRIAGALAGAA